MDKERKLIIAGNWKMNKTVSESIDLANGLVRELNDIKEVDIAICPPFTALSEVSKSIIDSNIRLGAQNMSQNNYGAHTGEIAAGMLKEFSTKYVILGHSERREYQRESNELIAAKSKTAHEAGLMPVLAAGVHHAHWVQDQAAACTVAVRRAPPLRRAVPRLTACLPATAALAPHVID